MSLVFDFLNNTGGSVSTKQGKRSNSTEGDRSRDTSVEPEVTTGNIRLYEQSEDGVSEQ